MTGRKGLLTLFGAFAAPVILAAIVYQMGWFNPGVTNKGEFMSREITLKWLLPAAGKDTRWTVFYPLESDCSQRCNNALYSLNQGWQALGKLQGKADPLVVRPGLANISNEQLKQQYGYIKVLEQPATALAGLQHLSSDYLYLVDPFGKVILRYKTSSDEHAMIMITKDWIADLKRLLKYARTS